MSVQVAKYYAGKNKVDFNLVWYTNIDPPHQQLLQKYYQKLTKTLYTKDLHDNLYSWNGVKSQNFHKVSLTCGKQYEAWCYVYNSSSLQRPNSIWTLSHPNQSQIQSNLYIQGRVIYKGPYVITDITVCKNLSIPQPTGQGRSHIFERLG